MRRLGPKRGPMNTAKVARHPRSRKTGQAFPAGRLQPIERIIAELIEKRRQALEDGMSNTESPIEALFLLACLNTWMGDVPPYETDLAYDRMLNVRSVDDTGLGTISFELVATDFNGGYMFAQVPVNTKSGRYRLDFALCYQSVEIAVELDGHDFHEKTKEQAANDKAKDRALTAAGWVVVRFTGAEVYTDPEKCANELFAIAGSASARQQRTKKRAG